MRDKTDKSLAQILPPHGKLTLVSLELPASLNKAQWQELGVALGRLDEAKQWWLGDWWAFGGHKYGERKALVGDDDWDGPAFGTCANAASVCRAFETSRRRELLTFSHHEVLAKLRLKPELVDELLDWCESPLKHGSKRPHSTHELELEILHRDNCALYTQVIRALDKTILRRCKSLSKAKADAFKDAIKQEITSQLRDKLDTSRREH